MIRDVLIIGSGPAGLTAAIYLSRGGLKPIIIAGDKPGGQLVNTDVVENYPGFKSIRGSELMINMLTQAEALGTEIVYESTKSISKNRETFCVNLSSGDSMFSKTIIIATGAKHKRLGISGEEEFTNRGVSWCATCDGPMYKGKKVAVVGGGNTAAMEAMFLSNFAEEVFLIHRRDKLRADKITQEKLFDKNKIKCIWNSEVMEIMGKNKLQSIKIKNSTTGGETILDLDGLFIAIGSVPSSEFARDLAPLDEEGYIIAQNTTTICSGLFAVGDVVSGSLKQAIYAAGQGALAAKYVEEFLKLR